jgi:L,D-transpeptidase catalytic domain
MTSDYSFLGTFMGRLLSKSLSFSRNMRQFIQIAVFTSRILPGSAFLTLIFAAPAAATPAIEEIALTLYQSIDFGTEGQPAYDLFLRGIAGFYELKEEENLADKEVITLIDFRKSGNEKRLWVVDIKERKLLFHSLVAHGRNSGDVFANQFSNQHESNQSSLGFYVTGNTYWGKHGLSLKLHGIEEGINDQAEARAIVMHGAEYVSDEYIRKIGRLGRSFGCPAVPMSVHKEMITTLAGGTCLFIFYPDPNYLSATRVGKTMPEETMAADN